MAQENIAVARPYAEALLSRARETNSLDLWSDMLELMSAVVQSPEISNLLTSPKLSSTQIESVLLEIGGEHLSAEGRNLIKLLVHNRRVSSLPDIAAFYEQLKSTIQGVMKVHVCSAYPFDTTQEQTLAAILKERLQRSVIIESEHNSDLIGGAIIKVGDLVIDGSVRGQLHRLANQLRI